MKTLLFQILMELRAIRKLLYAKEEKRLWEETFEYDYTRRELSKNPDIEKIQLPVVLGNDPVRKLLEKNALHK